jgi:hypothetical protein
VLEQLSPATGTGREVELQSARLGRRPESPARNWTAARGHRARQHPLGFQAMRKGPAGCGAQGNSDYTRIPQGYHNQEDGIDPVPAIGRARPRRSPACRFRGALGVVAGARLAGVRSPNDSRLEEGWPASNDPTADSIEPPVANAARRVTSRPATHRHRTRSRGSTSTGAIMSDAKQVRRGRLAFRPQVIDVLDERRAEPQAHA